MFALEPLTGKIVTPRFGGTAAVWSTCLFFYQFAVLCGYALTYFLSRLSFKKYISIYAAIVLISLLWMRLPAAEQWRPAGKGDPVGELLCLLVINVGVPSVLLSSVSGTMQVWYRNMNLGNPYPLYSVSNVGSLGALLAYPLLIEPGLTVGETLWWWGGGYFILVVGLLSSAWIARDKFVISAHKTDEDGASQNIGSEDNATINNSESATANNVVSGTTDEQRSGRKGDRQGDAVADDGATAIVSGDSEAAAEAGTPAVRKALNSDNQAPADNPPTQPKVAAAEAASALPSTFKPGKKERRKNRKEQAALKAAPPTTLIVPSETKPDEKIAEEVARPLAPVETESPHRSERLAKLKAEQETALAPVHPDPFSKQKQILVWTILSMLGSLVLLTHTAYITSDIAPVPLLWIAPLAIYLITFILVFASSIFYRPMLCIYLWPILTIVEMFIGDRFLAARIGINLLNVFLLCMICHGELAIAKPPAKDLALYWLCTSVGGVLGGLLVSVAAPLLFDFYLERQLTFICMLIVCFFVILKRKVFLFGYKPITYTWVGWSALTLILLQVGESIVTEEYVHRARNFYGSVRVVKRGKTGRALLNGQVLHGEQILTPDMERVPLSYYQLPIAFVDTYLRYRSHGAPLNYAVVGLGVGTIAAYGRQGDRIDFFEIDRKIEQIAKKYFTYLSKSKGQVEVLLGDARATFQQLPNDKQYDLIVIDAFNGDAIPLHLCTEEAIRIYTAHMKQDGLLLFHVSNRYIRLKPPIASSARKLGLHPLAMDDGHSVYLILVRKQEEIAALKKVRAENMELLDALSLTDEPPSSAKGWTDDFADLVRYFKIQTERE
ncbi:MAG: fused MFS/spermidine synthase [Candidatus Obscuribacterales bacterium]|nr:fused MFS/spermidine synthase [Candidatus Obscuribacterales bacterium]